MEEQKRKAGANGYHSTHFSSKRKLTEEPKRENGSIRWSSVGGQQQKQQHSRYKKRLDKSQNNSLISPSMPQTFVPSLGFTIQNGGAGIQRTQSLHHSCSKCLPFSRNDFIDTEYIGAGLIDILTIDRGSIRGLLGWIAPTLTWTMTNDVIPLANPKKETLQSQRVQAAIKESARSLLEDTTANENSSESLAIKRQEGRAKLILNTMSGAVSTTILRLANYTLLFVLRRLFRHFYLQRSHVAMLKAAQERGVPVVFLPCHKSHMDYLILSIALINIGIKLPHIAAGDNLNIPIFSYFIHRLGGFFIRRKLDAGSKRDDLYRECLQEYIEQLLRANENIELYIEGSRSRSGKPSLPKTGLLSFLVEAVREGNVSDILLVPVGVAYDRIVERNFIRHELMGGSKKPENFIKAVGGVWRMITSDIGCVRLDFGQPFSLQEYLQSLSVSHYSLMSLINHCPSSPNTSKRSSIDRKAITALSHHIVYDFSEATTVMSTNIVGFLLMTKHRRGTTVAQLIDSYKWLADRVLTCGRALGFSGSPSEAVHYALNYLSHLVTYNDSSGSASVSTGGDHEVQRVIYPKLELPDVFQLSHHSNQVNVLFMKEAIAACSLVALLEETRRRNASQRNRQDRRDDDDDEEGNTSPEHVSQEQLLDYAFDLTKMIGREFTFAPPCFDVTAALYDGIEGLVIANILKQPSRTNNLHERKPHNVSEWSDESDCEEDEPDVLLEVSMTQQARSHLSFLVSILGPFIEGYWSIAVKLQSLWKQQQQQENKEDNPHESHFLQELQISMIASYKEGQLIHVESCSMDLLRNGLRSFVSLEVISVNTDGHVYVINEEELQSFSSLLFYCKV